MAREYLADLNAEQRHAVQHGIDAECPLERVPTAPFAIFPPKNWSERACRRPAIPRAPSDRA